MAFFARVKQVTAPLDDKVKARIFEPVYFSSGSDHSAAADDDDDLLNGFLEDDDGSVQFPVEESTGDCEPDYYSVHDVSRVLMNEKPDPFCNVLQSRVLQAIGLFSYLKSNKSMLRRNVMAVLRKSGYNAGICKSKWENSGGLIAGKHEFIDVVRSEPSVRYFIELDFAGEFEIARPTNQYELLLKTLPKVFVGNSDCLKQIVKVVSDAARRSLKSRELHIPPWRKNRFMQNKWFASYKRTTNSVPENMATLYVNVKPKTNIKCRSVGFDAVSRVYNFSGRNSEIK